MDTTSNQPLPVTYADVAVAAEQFTGVAHRTPALTSRSVDQRTGALVAAALLEGKPDARGKRIGVIISGGNADLKNLAARLS